MSIKYSGGVFIDNNAKHIAEIGAQRFKNMLPVLVNETKNLQPLPVNDPVMEKYFARFPGNNYAEFIKTNTKDDTFDPLSGVPKIYLDDTEKYIDTLIKANPTGRYYVIFDWDRTLTMFEGFIPPDICYAQSYKCKADSKEWWQHMLEYLFGGKERLTMIRDFITKMIDKGVDIFILTNNGICARTMFLVLVKALHEGIKKDHILCSRPKGGDKGLTAKDSAFFEEEAPISNGSGGSIGGSRKRRRQKKRTRRRASKKQN
jgi:hypothetical protein